MLVPVHLYFRDGTDALIRVRVEGPVTNLSVNLPGPLSRVVFNDRDAVLAEVKETRWR